MKCVITNNFKWLFNYYHFLHSNEEKSNRRLVDMCWLRGKSLAPLSSLAPCTFIWLWIGMDVWNFFLYVYRRNEYEHFVTYFEKQITILSALCKRSAISSTYNDVDDKQNITMQTEQHENMDSNKMSKNKENITRK